MSNPSAWSRSEARVRARLRRNSRLYLQYPVTCPYCEASIEREEFPTHMHNHELEDPQFFAAINKEFPQTEEIG